MSEESKIGHKINRYFNHKEMLCVNCIWGGISSKSGIYCRKIKQKPNYVFYCTEYKLRSKSKYYHENLLKLAIRDKKFNVPPLSFTKLHVLISFSIIFFVIAIMVFMFIVFPLIAFVVVFVLFFASIPLSLIFGSSVFEIGSDKKANAAYFRSSFPGRRYSKFIHPPYYFITLAIHAYNKKTTQTNEELKIIEQNVLRVFGVPFLQFAKDFLLKGYKFEITDPQFNKMALKMPYNHRLLVFWMVCEMYVFDNLDDFMKSDVIKEIAETLDIKPEDYTQVKKELELQEHKYQRKKEEERLAAEAEKRQQEAQRRRASQIFTIKRTNYYSVLGLTSKATDDEIKKRVRDLALKYHPDRFVNDIEGQQKAVEKFKKITEAYNYIRDERGI